MMRLVLIAWFLWATTIEAVSSEIDTLLTVTGTEFRKTLDALANDAATVERLRAQPVVGSGGNELRRELIRQLVLAKADAPEVFAAFDDLLGLIRPDSPMLEPGMWDNLVRQERDGHADEEMLRHAMGQKWLSAPPANAEEWIKTYREISPNLSKPDAKRMANRFWPPIAFGLTAEPERLRKHMRPAFGVWCTQEKLGELQLEALLWLCEMTDYDREVVSRYTSIIHGGFEMPEVNQANLVTRRLAILESHERFVSTDARIDVVHGYMDSAERFGDSGHAPIIRRLADMPTWSAFQIRMLEVADKLEKGNDKSGLK